MQKLNLPKAILISTFLIALTLIAGLFIYGYIEIKKAENLPVDFIEPVKPVKNNNQEPKPVEPTKPVELETYEAELFIEAKWGEGEREVGLYTSKSDTGDVGPKYGPESFDVDNKTGCLYLLDSVNQRVIVYDNNGEYLRTFPIACGGTGDVRVSPDYKYLYVWSGRCGAIYKYSITGKFLESYQVVPEKNPGIGTGGMAFDENGNVMLNLRIKDYDKKSIFYQVGKNGDEWKENNCKGYISKDGKEYYLLGGVVKNTGEMERQLLVFNRNDELKRKFNLELSRKGLPYFVGLDKNNDIYLEIQYVDGSSDNEMRKYNQNGNLLTVLDVSELIRKNDFVWYYTSIFNDYRVSENGDIYLMFSDVGKIKIYKYSKIN